MPAASCLPLAIVGNDPAFRACIQIAMSYGMDSGRDVRAFVALIYRSVYTQLSDITLNALRAHAAGRG